MSVVRRCRRCRKIFTFSFSPPEPLYQFQPYLAQSILGRRGFTFFQMNGPSLFQGETITKYRKNINEILKFSSPKPLRQFRSNLAHKFLGGGDIFKFVQMKNPALFSKGK